MQTTVIAEIGVNHQNDLQIAEKLIHEAVSAGAQVVKFQASTVMEEVSAKAALDHFKELGELVPTWAFLMSCAEMVRAAGAEFMCTPAGSESLRFVAEQLACPRIKISSDNITNVPFLQEVARYDKPVILSTGMATLEDVMAAVRWLGGRHRLTLLQCVSLYPCPVELINLQAMDLLRRYGIVGLSDHTQSTLVPALAVAMGAQVIEKHLTLDHSLPGPDHAASMTPDQFRAMVDAIKLAEAARGTGGKIPSKQEWVAANVYRKSIVASRPIKMGEMFTPDNVTTKRPGTGRPAAHWHSVLGTYAGRDYSEDDLI